MNSSRQAAKAAAIEDAHAHARSGKPNFADALEVLGAHRRDAILEAVAMSAKELLRSSDLQQSLPKVIERIGLATGVDRVHILRIDPAAVDRGLVVEHHVWSAPEISTPGFFKNAKDLAMSDVGLEPWLRRLAAGKVVVGHVRDFAESARKFFESAGVKSAMAVPVFTDGCWWGLIGFDDCRNERDWLPAEIDTIKTLAELVGGAIARASHLKSLADATRIVERSPTILYRLSPDAPFPLTYISQNMRRYGYDANALLATPNEWPNLIESEDLPSIVANINLLVEGKTDQVQIDFRLKKPDGTIVWFDGEGYALRDRTGKLTGIEGVLTDVTDRKQVAEKIAMLARTDSLTGLANRAAFLERLRLEFARARRRNSKFAVLYLDLDHFKDVNDTLGHPVGDRLLQSVAERLKDCLRETDMVARFGGDEFAVLQDDIGDLAHIEALADKIAKTVAAPYRIGGNQVSTSASIGVVPYCDDIADADAMMMKADIALYRAKSEGRNRFRFHVAALDDETSERMMITEDLRHAVARGEFELYYQPQVKMTSGAVVGLEALIRWNHPRRGLMLPNTFISIAETTGSIAAIGEWVIAQACRQIKAWNERGIAPPVVAVNLSGAQFKLASQIDQIVIESLARYGIAAERLELELTETVLVETAERHREVFRRLQRAGVRLAIDDFGTGYSSLDYLCSFRVTRLKIDRRFIEDVTTNADAAAIVRATIGLAQELGIEVLAEGVETAAQRDFLIAAHCLMAQGFYFGGPMPAPAISERLGHPRLAAV